MVAIDSGIGEGYVYFVGKLFKIDRAMNCF